MTTSAAFSDDIAIELARGAHIAHAKLAYLDPGDQTHATLPWRYLPPVTQGVTMARCSESRLLDLPAEAAFDLVADVEAYPGFLPLWQRAEVVARSADGYDTVQTVGVGMLTQRFRTHTTVERPHAIAIASDDSLFRALNLRWRFQPEGPGRCRVDFSLDCEVAAWWLKPTIETMMAATAQSMIDAFQQRAASLNDAACANAVNDAACAAA